MIEHFTPVILLNSENTMEDSIDVCKNQNTEPLYEPSLAHLCVDMQNFWVVIPWTQQLIQIYYNKFTLVKLWSHSWWLPTDNWKKENMAYQHCPSLFSCAVIKHWPKSVWVRKRFNWLTGYSILLREAKIGTQVETMKEYCSLACW